MLNFKSGMPPRPGEVSADEDDKTISPARKSSRLNVSSPLQEMDGVAKTTGENIPKLPGSSSTGEKSQEITMNALAELFD